MRAGIVPNLLIPYFNLARASSFYLVTSVLGASTNWLLLRFIYSGTTLSEEDAPEASKGAPSGVILLSFLRDYGFWRDNARKLGIDIGKLAAQNRFICVDGLSELFAADEEEGPGSSSSNSSSSNSSSSSNIKPAVRGDHVVLRDPRLESIEKAMLDLISRMDGAISKGAANTTTTTTTTTTSEGGARESRTLLIVDGLDFLMAATGESPNVFLDMVMSWRENAHSVVFAMSADSPLIHNDSTPLEIDHLQLAVALGHQSRLVMSSRLLDSGTAKDVSGVMRISRGADADDEDAEREVLYFVNGDGSVKVFERGASV